MTRRKRSSFTLAVELAALILIFAIIVTAIGADITKQEFDKSEFPKRYSDAVELASAEYGISENLIYAIIKTESNFDRNAVSDAGAVGLMQIMPSTFESDIKNKLGISKSTESALRDYMINIRGGTYYFSYLYKLCGDVETALAMYNAGIGTVKGWLSESKYSKDGKTLIVDNIPFPETRAYVARVLYYREKYDQLYGQGFLSAVNDPIFKKYNVNIKWVTTEKENGDIVANELACYAWALHYCEKYKNVDPVFVMAIIKAESDFCVNAVSSTGAYGLMQIVPNTYDDIRLKLGLTESFSKLLKDPKLAIQCGVYYIDWLYSPSLKLGDELINIAAAYNGGCTAAKNWIDTPGLSQNGVLIPDKIPKEETRNYVKKVMANYEYYKEYLGNIFTEKN